MLLEAAIVGVIAVVLGALGGSVTLWALVRTAPLVVGFETPYRPDWSAIATSGCLTVVIALAAAALPAGRAARTKVIPALRYE